MTGPVYIIPYDCVGEILEYDADSGLYRIWTTEGGEVSSGWFKDTDLLPSDRPMMDDTETIH